MTVRGVAQALLHQEPVRKIVQSQLAQNLFLERKEIVPNRLKVRRWMWHEASLSVTTLVGNWYPCAMFGCMQNVCHILSHPLVRFWSLTNPQFIGAGYEHRRYCLLRRVARAIRCVLTRLRCVIFGGPALSLLLLLPTPPRNPAKLDA